MQLEPAHNITACGRKLISRINLILYSCVYMYYNIVKI